MSAAAVRKERTPYQQPLEEVVARVVRSFGQQKYNSQCLPWSILLIPNTSSSPMRRLLPYVETWSTLDLGTEIPEFVVLTAASSIQRY